MACETCVKHSDYKTDNLLTWCTSCGNYSIWGAVRNSLVASDIKPHEVLFVHDIGCNGNGADKIKGYGIKGLHGRAVPVAAGAAIANENVKVIASCGDGAVLAEGIGHLIHAIRSNYNFTLIIHNNGNFALTTGQPSPTTPEAVKMYGTPDGVTTPAINISQLVLPLKPSFYARGFSGKQKELTTILQQAYKHNGFSIVEVLQSCPTYNGFTTNDWYLKRIKSVDEISGYNHTDLAGAIKISGDLQERIATGLLYSDPYAISFNKRISARESIQTQLVDEVSSFDIKPLLAEFR